MVGGQEHFSCEKDPRDLWLFSLKMRGVQGDLTARFQSQKKPTRKLQRDFWPDHVVTGQRLVLLN